MEKYVTKSKGTVIMGWILLAFFAAEKLKKRLCWESWDLHIQK